MTGKLTITIDKNTSGGAERVAVVLANYFANNGYHVNIINADRDSCFYPVDSKVTVIKMGLDYSKSGVVHSAIRCIKKWLFLMEYFQVHVYGVTGIKWNFRLVMNTREARFRLDFIKKEACMI